MKVTLLNKEGFFSSIDIAAHAALICTGNEDYRRDDNRKFLTSLINKGHESVIEHVVLSFEIDGVSRALLQEWARHRLQALSVRSTRYTLTKYLFGEEHGYDEFRKSIFYVLSKIIDKEKALGDEFYETKVNTGEYEGNFTTVPELPSDVIFDIVADVNEVLKNLRRLRFCTDSMTDRQLADVVKYFLPEATPTKFVTTVNARELRHIFKLRSSPAALWEFQQLTHAIYEAIPEEGRFLFEGTIHGA